MDGSWLLGVIQKYAHKQWELLRNVIFLVAKKGGGVRNKKNGYIDIWMNPMLYERTEENIKSELSPNKKKKDMLKYGDVSMFCSKTRDTFIH